MTSIISTVLIGLGMLFLLLGIFGLYGLALSRNIGLGLLSIIFPVILLVLIADEEGIKRWGRIVIGVILIVIGLVINQ